MHIRAPIWVLALRSPGAGAFATLFALESCARALLATLVVVDLQRMTGSADITSQFIFTVAAFGLCANFAIPLLMRRIGRRWVYTTGGISLILSAFLMMPQVLALQVPGMALRVFGVVCFNICLNLYILDTLKGAQLNRLEPLRMLAAAVPWCFGPALGVQLAASVEHWVPLVLSQGFVVVLLIFFWVLRTREDSPLPVMRRPPPNPVTHIWSFLSRPRLRLSYVIAITRSTYWSMLFTYGPIYCIEMGLGEVVGGYLVSAANAFLFSAPLIGMLGRRAGIRRLIVGSFILTATAGFGAALFAGLPWVGLAFLLLGAFGAFVLDVTGNVPFLRLVRPSERQTMTPVFATYREFSDCVPPGLFSILLRYFPLPVVFLTTGVAQAAAALYALRLPRRL